MPWHGASCAPCVQMCRAFLVAYRIKRLNDVDGRLIDLSIGFASLALSEADHRQLEPVAISVTIVSELATPLLQKLGRGS